MLQLANEKRLMLFGLLALEQVRLCLMLTLAGPGGASHGIDENRGMEWALQHRHVPQQLRQARVSMAAPGSEQHKGKVRPKVAVGGPRLQALSGLSAAELLPSQSPRPPGPDRTQARLAACRTGACGRARRAITPDGPNGL